MARNDKDKEATERLSCRIPAVQDKAIERIRANGIFGKNRSAVVRTLLQRALDNLAETKYVQNLNSMFEELDKKGP